jgi:uncharacterized membrane protein YfcA
MELFGYFLSLIMGLILGLLGGGGSILTVPILVYCFNIPATLATGYSLFIVGITSLVAALRYKKDQLLDIKVAIFFSIPSIIGVLFSRLFILPIIPEYLQITRYLISKDQLVLFVFGLLIIVISFFMFRSKDEETKGLKEEDNVRVTYPYLLIGIEGLLVGIVTGFVGAGGGFMIVPALTLLAKIPLRKAIATSLLIISSKSIIGFLGDIMGGISYSYSFIFSILLITLLGTAIGTQLNKYFSVSKLRKGFAYFVLIMGIFILIKEIN